MERGELYRITDSPVPATRQPAAGITCLWDVRYAKNFSLLNINPEQDESGSAPMRGAAQIALKRYPKYINIAEEWRRPKGTADAIFNDFNHEQFSTPKVDTVTENIIIDLIIEFMDVKPYDIVHWMDTHKYPWKRSSKADFHNVHLKDRRDAGRFYHHEQALPTTKKDWFLDAQLHNDRSLVHFIKKYSYPYTPTGVFESDERHLELWLKKYPTELLIRSHISLLENLKVRPVYNAPLLYQRLEIMLFWPLLAQLRSADSCIMYGFETIRGGMREIDKIAQNFQSFLMIDWSRFDHCVPYTIVEAFFTKFAQRLILVDEGYAATFSHPSHKDEFLKEADQLYKTENEEVRQMLSRHVFAQRVLNMLTFMFKWYKNFIYITPDGYAYKRMYAGVPSGIMLTQVIDSFANLYIILFHLLEFGLSVETVKKMRFFIMGDDNLVFTHMEVDQLINFMNFLEPRAKERFEMIINKLKSRPVGTRSSIEVLGYTNMCGYPIRNIDKLVAQMLYPERHVDDSDMCVRAVGLAYAACGSDRMFYDFCCDVYKHYRNKVKEDKITIRPTAYQGIFSIVDDEAIPALDIMPDFERTRHLGSHYQGPLNEQPYWDLEFFINRASPPRNCEKTLLNYLMYDRHTTCKILKI